ncbi:hypothetical protein C8R43DRAFT_1113005 [Mycena crocata]|nr:hypothetical protein C8R43DRAFT_1113005 [Mycena crocata]
MSWSLPLKLSEYRWDELFDAQVPASIPQHIKDLVDRMPQTDFDNAVYRGGALWKFETLSLLVEGAGTIDSGPLTCWRQYVVDSSNHIHQLALSQGLSSSPRKSARDKLWAAIDVVSKAGADKPAARQLLERWLRPSIAIASLHNGPRVQAVCNSSGVQVPSGSSRQLAVLHGLVKAGQESTLNRVMVTAFPSTTATTKGKRRECEPPVRSTQGESPYSLPIAPPIGSTSTLAGTKRTRQASREARLPLFPYAGAPSSPDHRPIAGSSKMASNAPASSTTFWFGLRDPTSPPGEPHLSPAPFLSTPFSHPPRPIALASNVATPSTSGSFGIPLPSVSTPRSDSDSLPPRPITLDSSILVPSTSFLIGIPPRSAPRSASEREDRPPSEISSSAAPAPASSTSFSSWSGLYSVPSPLRSPTT